MGYRRSHAVEVVRFTVIAGALRDVGPITLAASRNVGDVVQAIEADAATAAADPAARIARDQTRLGQVSGASASAPEAAWLQAERNQVKAQRLTDSVLLYQAPGAAWWDRPRTGPAAE